MPKSRGRSHTTLTETAEVVVRELEKLPRIKMIAPGEIKTTARRKSGVRHLTIIGTTAGFALIVTGQGVQKIAVHTNLPAKELLLELQRSKALQEFRFSYRERLPGT